MLLSFFILFFIIFFCVLLILVIAKELKSEFIFKCPFCNKGFFSYRLYCIHVSMKHKKEIEKENKK